METTHAMHLLMLSSPTYPKLRSQLRRAPENEPAAHRELSRLLGTSALIQNHLGGRVSKMALFIHLRSFPGHNPRIPGAFPDTTSEFGRLPWPNFGSASSVSC